MTMEAVPLGLLPLEQAKRVLAAASERREMNPETRAQTIALFSIVVWAEGIDARFAAIERFLGLPGNKPGG